MRIWIDGYEANVAQRLGSSQVAFELLKNIEKLDKDNDYTILLPTPPMEDLPKQRAGWQYKILKPSKLWTQIALPLALYTAKYKPDLIFTPTHYIPRFSPVKRIVTIFDLGFLHFPESFLKKDLWQLKNWTKFSVQNTSSVITISNFSKRDLINQYDIDKNKITVAYPGYERERFNENLSKEKIEQAKKKYHTTDKYIIHIGTLQPRKNLIRLIEAFARVVRSHSDLKLLLVGKGGGLGRQGWLYKDILQTPERLGIQDSVIFTGFVPGDDLPFLLRGAKALIQISLWEGFGITILEAMGSGVPVIVSNVSALPEVVGEAGLSVDPYSLDQIEQAIRTVVSDKSLQQQYTKKGLIQAKKYSWQKMAKIVLEVFKKTADSKG